MSGSARACTQCTPQDDGGVAQDDAHAQAHGTAQRSGAQTCWPTRRVCTHKQHDDGVAQDDAHDQPVHDAVVHERVHGAAQHILGRQVALLWRQKGAAGHAHCLLCAVLNHSSGTAS